MDDVSASQKKEKIDVNRVKELVSEGERESGTRVEQALTSFSARGQGRAVNKPPIHSGREQMERNITVTLQNP
ncbi:hypothetical protein BaRGS_00027214, partial [Batillaria attramentaria]